MQILVDADACPVVIRDILYRAAQKRGIKLTLFANQSFQIPASPLISLYQVAKGPDMADHEIACLLYTSPSPRDRSLSRMPSSA